MRTADLPHELYQTHSNLWQVCSSMDAARINISVNGKWTPLQHLQHVHKGIAAISDYLKLDKKIIQQTFGIASHQSRTYDGVLQAYTVRLREGAVSTSRFNPVESRDIYLLTELETGKGLIEDIIGSLHHWSDAELDQYTCPHPTLGMLTAREMLFFAVIHAIHHTRSVHALTGMP